MKADIDVRLDRKRRERGQDDMFGYFSELTAYT